MFNKKLKIEGIEIERIPQFPNLKPHAKQPSVKYKQKYTLNFTFYYNDLTVYFLPLENFNKKHFPIQRNLSTKSYKNQF